MIIQKVGRALPVLLALFCLVIICFTIYIGVSPDTLELHPKNGHLQLTVSWKKGWLSGEYMVFRRILPKGKTETVYTGSGESFTDTLKPGIRYSYKVVLASFPFVGSEWAEVKMEDRFGSLRKRLYKSVDSHFAQFADHGNIKAVSSSRVPAKRWIYDDALGILVYTLANQQGKAGQILDNLAKLQYSNGSINFFYNTSGEESERYIRNGALAWVGYAAAVYEKRFGDRKFRPFTEKIAIYLVNCGADKGKVIGGEGSYLDDHGYRPGKVKWHSTEHNLDSYYFFRELALASGEPKYTRYAEKIHDRLVAEFWVEQGGYFKTGSNNNSVNLDNITWGGIFLLGHKYHNKAAGMIENLKQFRTGYTTPDKTVLSGYTDPNLFEQVPGGNNIWVEGTFGAILYLIRMGEDVEGLLNSMEKAFYTMDTKLSDQAWGYLVLEDNEFLWAEK